MKKRFLFVRTFAVEAEDEDEAWILLDVGLEDERDAGTPLDDSWAIDDEGHKSDP
jgi:hypothetical protein